MLKSYFTYIPVSPLCLKNYVKLVCFPVINEGERNSKMAKYYKQEVIEKYDS